jgi:hypothetical protein
MITEVRQGRGPTLEPCRWRPQDVKLPDAAAQAEVAQVIVAEGLTRDEVAELVRAVRAKRPTPAARPDPVTLDLGDGMTFSIRWRKANGVGVLDALKRAMKQVKAMDAA